MTKVGKGSGKNAMIEQHAELLEEPQTQKEVGGEEKNPLEDSDRTKTDPLIGDMRKETYDLKLLK